MSRRAAENGLCLFPCASATCHRPVPSSPTYCHGAGTGCNVARTALLCPPRPCPTGLRTSTSCSASCGADTSNNGRARSDAACDPMPKGRSGRALPSSSSNDNSKGSSVGGGVFRLCGAVYVSLLSSSLALMPVFCIHGAALGLHAVVRCRRQGHGDRLVFVPPGRTQSSRFASLSTFCPPAIVTVQVTQREGNARVRKLPLVGAGCSCWLLLLLLLLLFSAQLECVWMCTARNAMQELYANCVRRADSHPCTVNFAVCDHA